MKVFWIAVQLAVSCAMAALLFASEASAQMYRPEPFEPAAAAPSLAPGLTGTGIHALDSQFDQGQDVFAFQVFGGLSFSAHDILEKYYRAVAKDISVPRSLVTSAPRDELVAAASELAQSAVSGYIRALGRAMPLPDEEFQSYPFSLSNATLWLMRDELDQLAAELQALLAKYETRRGVEGEQEATLFTILYPAQLATEPEPAPPRLEAQTGERPSDQPPPAREPKIHRVWAAGAVSYARKDLEGVAARGERLDISVLGACLFASDIPAELVDRTVARFRCRGALTASPAVWEIRPRV
jgi:hypothetical protein